MSVRKQKWNGPTICCDVYQSVYSEWLDRVLIAGERRIEIPEPEARRWLDKSDYVLEHDAEAYAEELLERGELIDAESEPETEGRGEIFDESDDSAERRDADAGRAIGPDAGDDADALDEH